MGYVSIKLDYLNMRRIDMRQKHSHEYYNDRCTKLEEFGFEIEHMDSNVSMYANGCYVNFDFTGIQEQDWFKHTVKTAYLKGKEDGRVEVQLDMKRLLGVNN